MRIFTSHGGRGNEGNMSLDGLNVGAAFNGGGVSGYILDTANAQEIQMNLSGGLGEAEKGGIYLNVIPKTGGNMFKGELFGSAAGSWSQGSNLDSTLQSYGIQNPATIHNNYDTSGALGGPIKKDTLWFYGSIRYFGQAQDIPGLVRERQRRRPECVDVRRESGDHGPKRQQPGHLLRAGSPGRRRRGTSSASTRITRRSAVRRRTLTSQRRRLPRRRFQLARDRIVRRLPVARGVHHLQPGAAERLAGHVELDGHEQAAARSRGSRAT